MHVKFPRGFCCAKPSFSETRNLCCNLNRWRFPSLCSYAGHQYVYSGVSSQHKSFHSCHMNTSLPHESSLCGFSGLMNLLRCDHINCMQLSIPDAWPPCDFSVLLFLGLCKGIEGTSICHSWSLRKKYLKSRFWKSYSFSVPTSNKLWELYGYGIHCNCRDWCCHRSNECSMTHYLSSR